MTTEPEEITPEADAPEADAPEADAPEPDAREGDARAQGWVPEEEWKGPPEKWRDLDKFLDVGERIKRSHKDLRQEIKAQEKHNRELKAAVNQLIQGQDAIRKSERDKTIKELKSERRDAVADGDVLKVEALDTAIEREKEVPAAPQQKGPPPEVEAWLAENDWYGPQNSEATAFAQALDSTNAQKGISVDQSLVLVSKEVRKRFPELFGEPEPAPTPRRRAPAVESAGKSRPSKSTSFSDLNDAQKEIAKQFEEQGIMSVKDYIKAIAESEGNS